MPTHDTTASNPYEERWVRTRRAGRGMRCDVWHAEDRLLGRSVALKVPQHARFAGTLLEEARRTARVRSPHVVQIHDVIWDELPLLVLEWLEGSTLRDRLEARSPASLPDLVEPLRELLQAIEAAHAVGIVHADIKPENVWVREDGHLVLFDLGGNPQPGGDATALYAAPEVLEGQVPTPAADQYALGTLVFEWLCGRLPFDGVDPLELAARKRQQAAPRVRAAGGEVPAEVEAWVARCLAAAPGERFPSIADARHAWERLGEHLQPRLRQRTGLHADAADRLERALNSPASDGRRVICLEAEWGLGKSSLMHRVVDRDPRGFAVVLRLRGESGVPAWETWRRAARAHADRRWLRLPEARDTLPALLESLADPNATDANGARAHLVIVVDDFETCDLETCDWLAWLAAQPCAGRLALVVASNAQRQDAAHRRLWCRLLDASTLRIRLQRPDRDLLRELLCHHLEVTAVSDTLVDWILERSGANPRFATLLAEALRDQGALEIHSGTASLRVERIRDELPAALRPHLRARLDGLDERSVDLLREAALHGQRFEAGRLAARLGIDVEPLVERLHAITEATDVLRREGAHWMFREPLLVRYLASTWSDEHRRGAHRALAEILAQEDSPDHAALGTHYFASGDRARAQPHLEAAGREALARHDAQAARSFLQRALDALPHEPQSEQDAEHRCEVLQALAAAERLGAAWETAMDHLREAALLAQAWGRPTDEVAALRGQGEVEYARSRFDDALAHYDAACEAAARAGDDDARHEILLKMGNIHFERGRFEAALETYATVLEYAARHDHQDLEARASNNLALVESSVGRKDSAIQMFQRSLELFRKLGREDAVARIEHNIGMAYLELGNPSEARNSFERCIERASRLGLDELRSVSSLDHAEATLALGQVEVARESIEHALALCQERGDRLGIATAHRLLGRVHARQENLRAAEREIRTGIRLLRDLGDTPHLGLALRDLARVLLEARRSGEAHLTLMEARKVLASLDTPHEAAQEVEALIARVEREGTTP